MSSIISKVHCLLVQHSGLDGLSIRPFPLKVEAMRRRDLYQRMSLLERISEGTEKAKTLVEQRSQLQEQRRTANMEASFQRQRLQVRSEY